MMAELTSLCLSTTLLIAIYQVSVLCNQIPINLLLFHFKNPSKELKYSLKSFPRCTLIDLLRKRSTVQLFFKKSCVTIKLKLFHITMLLKKAFQYTVVYQTSDVENQ